MTFEPLSEAELQELQALWMASTRLDLDRATAPRRLHNDGPLAEDWTRHTADVEHQPVSLQRKRASVWEWLAAAAIVVVFYTACWLFAKWVAHR